MKEKGGKVANGDHTKGWLSFTPCSLPISISGQLPAPRSSCKNRFLLCALKINLLTRQTEKSLESEKMVSSAMRRQQLPFIPPFSSTRTLFLNWSYILYDDHSINFRKIPYINTTGWRAKWHKICAVWHFS